MMETKYQLDLINKIFNFNENLNLYEYLFFFAFFLSIYIVIQIVISIKSKKIKIINTTVLVCVLLPLAFCFVGYSVGLHSGRSRIPVMDAILPASLTLFSTILIFFLKSKDHKQILLVSIMLLAFTLTLSYGIHKGSFDRSQVENRERFYNDVIKKQFEIIHEANRIDLLGQ